MKISVKYGDAVVVEAHSRWGVSKELDISLVLCEDNDAGDPVERTVFLTAEQADKVATNLISAARDVRTSGAE